MMNLRRGTVSTRNTAAALAVAAVLVIGAYVIINSGQFSAPKASSKLTSLTSSTATLPVIISQSQLHGILNLFGNFSRVELSTSYSDEVNEDAGHAGASYVVLGRTFLNSTNYYRVEFKNLGSNTSEIAWFTPQGGIDRVDVPRNKNYTGPGAAFYAQTFTSFFSLLPALSNNATLLSGLQKTGTSVESIGLTQMSITTYGLRQPTSAYTNFTVKIATVPGTNIKLVIYFFQEYPNRSNYLFQVVSLTRA